jgi:hypothetical protein
LRSLIDEIQDIIDQFEERLRTAGWHSDLERRWETTSTCFVLPANRAEISCATENEEVLDISIKFATTEQAHAKGAIYLDHNFLHNYWNEYRRKCHVDWNSGMAS